MSDDTLEDKIKEFLEKNGAKQRVYLSGLVDNGVQ